MPAQVTYSLPVISTFDPRFDPSLLTMSNGMPTGSRYDAVPHHGPGTAVYVRQPSRAQLKANTSLFGNPNRPFFIKDPEDKMFIDVDGKEAGKRWIMVDPRGGEETNSSGGCQIM